MNKYTAKKLLDHTHPGNGLNSDEVNIFLEALDEYYTENYRTNSKIFNIHYGDILFQTYYSQYLDYEDTKVIINNVASAVKEDIILTIINGDDLDINAIY